jgi:hypothetical protein
VGPGQVVRRVSCHAVSMRLALAGEPSDGEPETLSKSGPLAGISRQL